MIMMIGSPTYKHTINSDQHYKLQKLKIMHVYTYTHTHSPFSFIPNPTSSATTSTVIVSGWLVRGFIPWLLKAIESTWSNGSCDHRIDDIADAYEVVKMVSCNNFYNQIKFWMLIKRIT